MSKVGVAYRAAERVLIYAQANEGFRPGGANQVVGLAAGVDSLRGGLAVELRAGAEEQLVRRPRVAQRRRVPHRLGQHAGHRHDADGAFRFISNAGEAQIDGAELEALALVSPAFQVSLAAAYTDAKLSEDQISADVLAAGREGDRIPNVPRFSASFAAEYQRALGATLQGSVRADVSYVGSSFSELRPDQSVLRAHRRLHDREPAPARGQRRVELERRSVRQQRVR